MRNFKRRCWQVAFRKTADNSTLPNSTDCFKTVKNPWWGWAADPFVFENEGKTYIFAEVYSFMQQKGMLGYCQLSGDSFGSWKVAIDEPFHLSYPNIMRWNGEIYICPESFVKGEVAIYRATQFPDKWERVASIADGPFSDTTFFERDGEIYGFTFNHLSKPVELLLFKMKEGKACFAKEPVSTDNSLARPGGNIFEADGGHIRVGQNGVGMYGSGLAFLKMNFSFDNYSEELVMRWSKDDIHLDKTPKGLKGLHTFNRGCGFEVIDVLFLTAAPLDILGRIVTGIKRRIKR